MVLREEITAADREETDREASTDREETIRVPETGRGGYQNRDNRGGQGRDGQRSFDGPRRDNQGSRDSPAEVIRTEITAADREETDREALTDQEETIRVPETDAEAIRTETAAADREEIQDVLPWIFRQLRRTSQVREPQSGE